MVLSAKSVSGIRSERQCVAISVMAIVVLSTVLLLLGAASAQQMTYEYDELGRLKNVDYGNSEGMDYSYDPAGNRTGMSMSGPAVGGVGQSGNITDPDAEVTYFPTPNGMLVIVVPSQI